MSYKAATIVLGVLLVGALVAIIVLATVHTRPRFLYKKKLQLVQDDVAKLGRSARVKTTEKMLQAKKQCPLKVIISMTTSPKRLEHAMTILSLLDSRSYDEIHLNLPRVYGRTQETYEIGEHVTSFPKLKIFMQELDEGPMMKLIPTVRREPNAVIITIDDDIAYNKSQPFDLLRALHLAKYRAIVGNCGFKDRKGVDFPQKEPTPLEMETLGAIKEEFPSARLLDIAEGFGMVAYVGSLVDPAKIEQASKLSKTCYRSDDVTISGTLEKDGVPRIMIVSAFPDVRHQPLDYGQESDALHVIQEHTPSYAKCLGQMGLVKK